MAGAYYSVNPRIIGESVKTHVYKYINDPLLVRVGSDSSQPIPIEVKKYSMVTQALISSEIAVTAETNSSNKVDIDFMKIIRNYIYDDYLKIGKIEDLSRQNIGLGLYGIQPVGSGLETKILVLSGVSTYGELTSKINIDHLSPTDEFTKAGTPCPKFLGYPYVQTTLKDISSVQNVQPTVLLTFPSSGREVCGLFVIWKSRLGGWVGYDFGIYDEELTSEYGGELPSDFSANDFGVGYMPQNYMKISSNQSINAKALRVPKNEIEGLRGLRTSPAIYTYKDGILELCRLTGFSAQLDNLKAGGDVSISLSPVQTLNQTIR